MNINELKKFNLETLKGNYYLSVINEKNPMLLETLAEKAAEKGYYIYVYTRGRSAKWGISTELTVLASKEERKRYTRRSKGYLYEESIELIYMERAYISKTPRGALWRKVIEAIEKLDKI